MKLTKVRVTEFQSVHDSNSFEISDITCLVGKNEAGKTALLKALYRLNPIIETEGNFSVTDDYPRAEVEDYRQAVDDKARDEATVITVTFMLEDEDLEDVFEIFGKQAITTRELKLTKGYSNERNWIFATDTQKALSYLFSTAQLTPEISKALSSCTAADAALEVLGEAEQTEETKRLSGILQKIKEHGLSWHIYNNFLRGRLPKFVYFDEYYQMRGFENIEALKQRQQNKTLRPSDHPMLGLIELARLNLDELLNPSRTQDLINKIEAAGNHLGRKVLKYWSQNKHLQMRFDVRPARPGDPEDMRTGTNVWAGVYDSRHMVTTNLGTRSKGFVWFFSFMAWYSRLQKNNEPLILLLDEPGLTLHAKAQEDLLRYFEEELKDAHQLLYTTHSPFMVDPRRFERVRIVQDKGIDAIAPLSPTEDGTKVLTDVLEASADSLFPLQGALGYEIYQSLFIGPNSLVVEGVSDLLYIQTVSTILESLGREGLRQEWTITPVGGSDKVPTFVALIGAQKALTVATLIDFQKKDQQTIENLYKKRLLDKSRVLTFADFTGTSEADIEDMFEADFYLKLVNEEYKQDLQTPLSSSTLNNNIPRISARLESYFQANPLQTNAKYNHYRPARYFSEHSGALSKKIPKKSLDKFEQAFKRLNSLL